MGLFGDLKKILFGAKSITKSAAGKAMDAGTEAGGKLLDSSEELLGKATESAGDIGGQLMDKAGDVFDKAKDVAGDLTEKAVEKGGDIFDSVKGFTDKTTDVVSDTVEGTGGSESIDKAKNVTENIGDKVLSAGEDVMDKTKNVVENVGSKVIETTAPLVDKAKNIAEDVGGKVLGAAGPMIVKGKDLAEDVGGKVMEKGKDVMGTFKDAADKAGDKFSEFYDAAQADAGKEEGKDMVEKAQDVVANQDMDKTVDDAKNLGADIDDAAKKRADKMFSNKPIDTSDSLLDGTDDFFSKADRFAKGDYHNTGKFDKPDIKGSNDLFANTEEAAKDGKIEDLNDSEESTDDADDKA